MSRCGCCGRDFSPGDDIDLAALPVPPLLLPLVRPYTNRLRLFRCLGPECQGLITGLFLPPPGVTPGSSAEASGVTP